MEPKISVIVPVYNVENYLKVCIDSITNQSYTNLEIILINDGSIDKSGEICDQYAHNDSRIIVRHQENKGQSSARNIGLTLATGDYIGFVDSDDWIELDMYKTMMQIGLNHQLDIIECDINVSRNGENTNFKKPGILKLENTSQAVERILKSTQFSVCTKLFKKSIIGNSRFLLNKTSEDAYFVVENIPKSNNIGYYSCPFYNYRSNPNGTTKSPYNLKRFDDAITSTLFIKSKWTPNTSSCVDSLKQDTDDKLSNIVLSFVLKELMYHYKMLNYYPELDKKYEHRKRLKKLIDTNYFKSKSHNKELKQAKKLSIKSFEVIISINKFKHKILKTNQFS
ncbi:glycosyltransferase [Psychroserpens damuponensis]|uniref:glycosyltransferase n=1 Tax=Psychroserpens damuponensis TaxID=943936 RepID=UPI00069334C6|nr:glycosyltransferase [Psychroserpens damuponensis]